MFFSMSGIKKKVLIRIDFIFFGNVVIEVGEDFKSFLGVIFVFLIIFLFKEIF